MIQVIKPFLPPIEEYQEYISGIWKRNWLTNNGPLVNQLELQLKEYLDTPHMLFLSNGTVALQIAIKALGLTGEIITTPFSFVATTSTISWEGCKPVFVDINAHTLNIDAAKIEAAITDQTQAILATHVYGNPCDIDAIAAIAHKHGLKVIYDAAHCFGTKYKGKSVFSYGDISTASFHATKLFHTVEGGAVFTQKPELLKKLSQLRNFGFNGPEAFEGMGINGKNSEFHAAMGLAIMPYMDKILTSCKTQSDRYTEKLKGLRVQHIKLNDKADYNYSYYPIVFGSEQALLKAHDVLQGHQITARRYFYPSLNLLDYTGDQKAPISEDISARVLCLPLYYDLSMEEIDLICRLLLRAQNN